MKEIKLEGMLKKLDDLSRVHIPKSIRDKIGINEDDTFEIFSHEDGIFLKKYFQNNWLNSIIPCVEYISYSLCEKVLVSNKENIIFETGDFHKFRSKAICRKIKEVFNYTDPNTSQANVPTITFRKNIEIVEGKMCENAIIATLLNNNCYIGSIIVLPKTKIEFKDSKSDIIQFAADMSNKILKQI